MINLCVACDGLTFVVMSFVVVNDLRWGNRSSP